MAPKKRIPQTASNRRRRSERLVKEAPSTSVVSYVEEDVVDNPSSQSEEEIEEVAERRSPTVVDSDIEDDSVHGPFPGGPETNELLVDYRHNVAYRVWNGKGDQSLRCRQPVKTLCGWNLEKESVTFYDRVKLSGLLPLTTYYFKTLNVPLITAMVER
ncbi:hypothetical protein QJS10_CPA09g00803 [Acorus calamus]|uniref:Uncharacterized protein n=1 Tax=Acorus calamus TaxID=4465 RepID=A0AAV9E3S1_ACOCL|nr:hypothetical protein QJS10_CPA09g00803 [Acorus calamus]